MASGETGDGEIVGVLTPEKICMLLFQEFAVIVTLGIFSNPLGSMCSVVRILLAYGSQLLDFCLSELALEKIYIYIGGEEYRPYGLPGLLESWLTYSLFCLSLIGWRYILVFDDFKLMPPQPDRSTSTMNTCKEQEAILHIGLVGDLADAVVATARYRLACPTSNKVIVMTIILHGFHDLHRFHSFHRGFHGLHCQTHMFLNRLRGLHAFHCLHGVHCRHGFQCLSGQFISCQLQAEPKC